MKKILLLVLSLVFSFSLVGCKEETEEIVFDVPNEFSVNMQDLPYAEYLSIRNPEVTITVQGMGDMVMQLFPDVAPNTVNNFIQYIQDGAYDGSDFHRVYSGFVIQGGDLDNPECVISGEMTNNDYQNDLHHYRGILSMARLAGSYLTAEDEKSSGDYDSQNSQFFIVHATNTGLDQQYASFGGLIRGFNVLDFITTLQSEEGQFPTTPVIITSITVDLNGYVPEDRVCLILE